MKIYSSDSITREDVEEMVKDAVRASGVNARQMADAVDVKQNKKIKFLERMLLLSFAVNIMFATGAYFVKL